MSSSCQLHPGKIRVSSLPAIILKLKSVFFKLSHLANLKEASEFWILENSVSTECSSLLLRSVHIYCLHNIRIKIQCFLWYFSLDQPERVHTLCINMFNGTLIHSLSFHSTLPSKTTVFPWAALLELVGVKDLCSRTHQWYLPKQQRTFCPSKMFLIASYSVLKIQLKLTDDFREENQKWKLTG